MYVFVAILLSLSSVQAYRILNHKASYSAINLLESLELDTLISTSNVDKLTQTLGRSLSIDPRSMPKMNKDSVDQIVASIKNTNNFKTVDLKGIISMLIAEGFITTEDHISNRIKVAIVLIKLQTMMKESHTMMKHHNKQKKHEEEEGERERVAFLDTQAVGGWAS